MPSGFTGMLRLRMETVQWSSRAWIGTSAPRKKRIVNNLMKVCIMIICSFVGGGVVEVDRRSIDRVI